MTVRATCGCGLLTVQRVGTTAVDGVETCNRCGLPIHFGAATITEATPEPASSPEDRAIDSIKTWARSGIMLWVLGGLIAFVAFANMSTDGADGGSITTAVVVAVIGGLVGLAGLLMLAVAVVAKGVQLGRRASWHEESSGR